MNRPGLLDARVNLALSGMEVIVLLMALREARRNFDDVGPPDVVNGLYARFMGLCSPTEHGPANDE